MFFRMVWIMKEIRQSKILVVGAGGIGCELLKNLVLSGFIYKKLLLEIRTFLYSTFLLIIPLSFFLKYTGFEDITVVDNDTIEVSNLNRQLLFQKKHVSKYKG